MSALQDFQNQIKKIGYSAIERDYVFSDVFAAPSVNRTASFAAFTTTPPSYRNAAIAVVEAAGRSALEIASDYRALGAPLLFVVEGDDVTVWKVRTESAPQPIEQVRSDELSELFAKHSDAWSPLSIQRAKSIGQFNPQYQLDFVDLGLLPAIEGEIHTKLDFLLQEALTEAIDARTGRSRISEHTLFRAVFRFLAAKILQDRSHQLAQEWDANKIETILGAISRYYKLPSLLLQAGTPDHRVLSSVWERIRRGINFQNISADDLAFVYENTLVTPEIRERFGTHSTPRQVAEYVVRHLDLHNYDPENLRVYEPFAGSAVFLVSALRHMRERLPMVWTDKQRHEFLVKRISGDEIDAFACEVAMLSLILADYPNHNGWQIRQTNLFENAALSTQMRAHNVILCNPPFEAFTSADRRRYPISKTTPFQAVAVLNAALDAHPLALGFVLPRPFILERQFEAQRQRIEKLYEAVELVELPDRTFRVSKTESALLIAHKPRHSGSSPIELRSTEVSDRDREKFLKCGETTRSREIVRSVTTPAVGELWISPLQELWSYLRSYPTLDRKLSVHRGIEWTYAQEAAWSATRQPGYRRGLHSGRHSQQFNLGRLVWLDCNEGSLRGGAINQPWRKPKLIVNAGRLSRGSWRLAAAFDKNGLVCSQQFFGLWPKTNCSESEMLSLAAVLNGPVANAFISMRSPQKGIRISALDAIPIPRMFEGTLAKLVGEYIEILNARHELIFNQQSHEQELLNLIDASVLAAYDLPPRLERELLEYFRGSLRPVAHSWQHWLPEGFKPFIPLHRYFSDEYKLATSGWVREVFKPLPADEANAVREYLG